MADPYAPHAAVPMKLGWLGECCAVCGGSLMDCRVCGSHIPMAAFGQEVCEACQPVPEVRAEAIRQAIRQAARVFHA